MSRRAELQLAECRDAANRVPLSTPRLRGNELRYVTECINSEWVSTVAPYVTRFEEEFAHHVGVGGCLALVNGTTALHLALHVAGIGEGDEVILPALTFIAPVNAVHYVGAIPVFLDCDDHLNLDSRQLDTFLRAGCSFDGHTLWNLSSGRRIRAILPVHIFGTLCDMDAIMSVAERYGLIVIEDASEAVGSRLVSGSFSGRSAGTVGHFGCYSFNANKIITTGGGGMLTARRAEDLGRARYLAHQAKDDTVRYCHGDIGFNFGMTAVQAALGVAQLEQLDEFCERKGTNYRRYRQAISSIQGLRLLAVPEYCESNHWFYALVIDPPVYGRTRDELMEEFERHGVQTRPIWTLNCDQPPYRACQAVDIVRARHYHERVLNLPCSVGLAEDDLDRVVAILRQSAVRR